MTCKRILSLVILVFFITLLQFELVFSADWQTETVVEPPNAHNSVFNSVSIALDDTGKPCISYYDPIAKEIKVAEKTPEGWQISSIDSAYSSKSSLKIDSTGKIHICYSYGIITGMYSQLKYAWKDQSGWHREAVDASADVSYSCSLGLDSSGNPHISYDDFTNGNVKYAFRNSSGWHKETVDSGSTSSISIDLQNRPHIAYYDRCNKALKYAYKDASVWKKETIDGISDVTGNISLTVDKGGWPHVCYYDNDNGYVIYAFRDNYGWHSDIAGFTKSDPYNEVHPSLAISQSGKPSISFYDYDNNSLIYTTINSDGWNPIKLENNFSDSGLYTALAIDKNGLPHIGYLDRSSKKLMYTREIKIIPRGLPDGPSNLYVTHESSGFRLSWLDNSDTETGFIIERKSPNRSFIKICEIPKNTTSFIDTDISTDEEYIYRIYACSDVGNSYYSNEASTLQPQQSLSPLDRWHKSEAFEDNVDIRAIAYGDGKFAVHGGIGDFPSYSGSLYATSTDLIDWTKKDVSSYTSLNSLTYANRKFVGIADDKIMTSNNGLNWVGHNQSLCDSLNAVCHGNGVFIALGSSGGHTLSAGDEWVGKILRSTDGIHWTNINISEKDPLFDICFGDGKFVAVGYNGRILTSSDGLSWSKRTSGTERVIHGVCYGEGVFVAVGSDGLLLFSEDGVTWTHKRTGTKALLRDIAYGRGTFVAAGNNGRILTSPDGKVWTRRASGTSEDLFGIAFGNNRFVAVGDNGTLIQANLLSSSGVSGRTPKDSDTVDIPGMLLVPQAPANLDAKAASHTQIDLTWTNTSMSSTSVKIERKTGYNGTYAEIAVLEAGTSSYSDTGLIPATTYYYRVKVFNSFGESEYSNQVFATTKIILDLNKAGPTKNQRRE